MGFRGMESGVSRHGIRGFEARNQGFRGAATMGMGFRGTAGGVSRHGNLGQGKAIFFIFLFNTHGEGRWWTCEICIFLG